MKRRNQCEARIHPSLGGSRCQFAAKHAHRAQTGDMIHVCSVHLRTILKRERLGSDEEILARWRG